MLVQHYAGLLAAVRELADEVGNGGVLFRGAAEAHQSPSFDLRALGDMAVEKVPLPVESGRRKVPYVAAVAEFQLGRLEDSSMEFGHLPRNVQLELFGIAATAQNVTTNQSM